MPKRLRRPVGSPTTFCTANFCSGSSPGRREIRMMPASPDRLPSGPAGSPGPPIKAHRSIVCDRPDPLPEEVHPSNPLQLHRTEGDFELGSARQRPTRCRLQKLSQPSVRQPSPRLAGEIARHRPSRCEPCVRKAFEVGQTAISSGSVWHPSSPLQHPSRGHSDTDAWLRAGSGQTGASFGFARCQDWCALGCVWGGGWER